MLREFTENHAKENHALSVAARSVDFLQYRSWLLRSAYKVCKDDCVYSLYAPTQIHLPTRLSGYPATYEPFWRQPRLAVRKPWQTPKRLI